MFLKPDKSFLHTVLTLFFLLFSASGIYASGKSDTYSGLIKNGASGDIKTALKKDSDLITYTEGSNNDTLLMSAVAYGRGRDVIKLLLDAGISPAKKNKLGQSAVSYICRYSADTGTASLVLSYGTFSKSQIRTRLMTKDKTGRYAAQYTDENKSPEIKQLVKSYLRESDIQLLFPAAETGGDTAAGTNQIAAVSPPSTVPAAPAVPADIPAAAADAAETVSSGLPAAESTPAELNREQEQVPSSVQQPPDISRDPDAAVPLPPSDTEPVLPPKTSAYQKTSLYDYAADAAAGGSTQDISPGSEFIPDADKAGPDGITPLMKAIRDGNDWLTEALLYSGADVNAADAEGWTPLMYAVRYQNDEKLTGTLIDHGAVIRTRNKYNASPLILAAQYSENPVIISRLLTAYSAGENEVFKAFIYAITGNASSDRIRLAKVQLFVNKGTPLNRFWEGKTPLMYAAETGCSTALIDLFIKNGAIISIRTSDKKTAFDFARINTSMPHDRIYWSLNTGR